MMQDSPADYGIAIGITAVARATLSLQTFPTSAYARSSAQLAVPLNLSYAVAPPVFAAIVASASPQVALWLALAISILPFMRCLAFYFCIAGWEAHLPRQDPEEGRSSAALPNAGGDLLC